MVIKMKVKCDKCSKDISKQVDKVFEEFDCGRIVCPHCKARQKRYISETDLLVYFGMAATLYFIMVTLVFLMFNYVAVDALTVVVIGGLLVINYFLFKWIDRFVYTKAPFKEKYKNFALDEDKAAVSKRTRWQFFAFIVVSLMLVGQPNLAGPYFFLLFAFIIIILIKIKLSVDNEKRHKGNG